MRAGILRDTGHRVRLISNIYNNLESAFRSKHNPSGINRMSFDTVLTHVIPGCGLNPNGETVEF
jgi:hypothetical protein